MCQICKQFLSDFLLTGIRQELQLTKSIRLKIIQKILPELTDWMYRIYQSVPRDQFKKALLTSGRIARRDRPLYEYEFILNTATFNFLKFEFEWLTKETEYMKTLLLEEGFLREKEDISLVNQYIGYTVSRVLVILEDLHKEHKLKKTKYKESKETEEYPADEYF